MADSRLLDMQQMPRLRQVVADQNHAAFAALPFTSISIGALLEVACAGLHWHNSDEGWERTAFAELCNRFPPAAQIHGRLVSAMRSPSSFRFVSSDADFVVIAIARASAFAEKDGVSWSEFQQAFVRRLKVSGFDASFATALSAAFFEIAENSPDHSAPEGQEMAPTLIGYWIAAGEVHFSVADTGRGVLASLQENPQWSWLATSREALMATIEKGATRKSFHGEGGGIRLLLKSFVDRNGLIHMSSGDGLARVGRVEGERVVTGGFGPWLAGMRVSATCQLRGIPEERMIPQH